MMEMRTRNPPRPCRLSKEDRSVKQQRVRTRAWILSIEVQMLETEWIFHRVGRNRIQQNKFDEVQFLDL